MNIAASLFNNDGAAHVRIASLYGPGGALPADVFALVQPLNERADFHLTVPGYGEGRIAVVLV